MSEESTGTTELAEPAEATESQAPETAQDNSAEAKDFEYFQSLERKAASSTAGDEEQPEEPQTEEATQPEARDETEDSDDAEQPAEKAESEKSDEPEGFDEALKAMQRLGIYSEDELVEMAQANLDQFIKRGMKLAKSQKDQDAFGFEYRKNRDAFEQWQSGGKDATSGRDAHATEAHRAPSDLLEAVKVKIGEVLDPLSSGDNADLYGDLKDPLAIAFTSIAEQMGAHHQAQLAERDQQMENIRASMIEMQIDSARNKALEKHPELSKNDVYERVLGQYDKLAKTGEYKSVASIFDDAVKLELGEQSSLTLKEKMLARVKQRKTGQPRSTTKTSKTESEPDNDWNVYQKLEKQYDGVFAD